MSLGRAARIAFAAWYLAAATSTIPVAAEQLAQRLHRRAAAAFACAGHVCGCRTAEQCRLRCCCFPRMKTVTPGAALSALPLDRCTGSSEADPMTQSIRLGPHLPLALAAMAPPVETGGVPDHANVLPNDLYADPPDKIPLALPS